MSPEELPRGTFLCKRIESLYWHGEKGRYPIGEEAATDEATLCTPEKLLVQWAAIRQPAPLLHRVLHSSGPCSLTLIPRLLPPCHRLLPSYYRLLALPFLPRHLTHADSVISPSNETFNVITIFRILIVVLCRFGFGFEALTLTCCFPFSAFSSSATHCCLCLFGLVTMSR